MRDWYNPGPAPAGETPEPQFKWRDILTHWSLIELDLHTTYQVDVEDGTLDRRTWRWLENRIADLVTTPSTRIAHALTVAAGASPT